MTDMIGTPQYSDRIRQLETSDQGQPETWNPQLKKLIDNDAYLKEQNDTHQVSTGPHGATSAATANRIILRDANGRAKIAAPSEADDIARKDTVDNHANLTAPHSATPSPTPSRLVLRDAAGRAQVAAPAAAEDIARKDTVDTAKTEVVGSGWDGTTLKQLKDEHDTHLADGAAHGAVSTATANKIIVRDANGRAKVAAPSASDDIARLDSITKAQVGLSNVTNDAQMPIAGGTFTGVVVAQNNTSYTTKQIRNITLSTSNPSGGSNGDVWIKYNA